MTHSIERSTKLLKASILLTTISVFTLPSLADEHFQTLNGCKVKMGAELTVEAGTRIQKSEYENTAVTTNNEGIGFNSNVAAHLTVENETRNNWNYGAQIGLSANTKGSAKAGKHYLDRTYLWTQHDNVGRFELGSNRSAAGEMQITSDKSGGWDNYVSVSTAAGVAKSNFLTGAKLVFKETTFNTPNERSRKITYYTPKNNGFQFGVSYIPDVTNNGSASSTPNTSTSPTRQEYNAIAPGITWEHEFAPNRTLEVALVGEFASLKRSTADKTAGRIYNKSKAVAIGATYTHGDLEISSSYGNHFKTNTQKISTDIPNAWYADLGAEYQLNDKLTIKGSALYSEKYSNPFKLFAAGAEYQIASGIKTYATIAHFNMNQKKAYFDVPHNSSSTTYSFGGTNYTETDATIRDSSYKNKGTAVILGSKFKF